MKRAICLIITAILLMTSVTIATAEGGHDPYAGINLTEFDSTINPGNSFRVDDRGFVASLVVNGYLVFKDVDFGDISPNFVEVYAGTAEGYEGTVDIYLDKNSGEPVASVPTVADGWAVRSSKIILTTKISGVHDVYIRKPSGSANLYKVVFYKPAVNTSGYEDYNDSNYFKDIAGHPWENEINTLYELGFVNGFTEDTYEPNIGISRLDFATLLYRIAGDNNKTDEPVPFKDVEAETEGYEAIQWLYQHGAIVGNGQNLFEPYKFVSTTDASVMALRLLGYEKVAQHYGGYPAGYLRLANQEDLIGGNVEPYLTRGEMAGFLCNFMEADYLTAVSFSDGVVNYTKKNGILSETKDIYIAEGTMTATGVTGLYTPLTDLESDEVSINDVVYKVGESSALSYLGYDVNIYYQQVGDDRVLLNARPQKSVDTTILNGLKTKITDITESEVSYIDEEGKKDSISFESDAAFIYNGKAIEASLSSYVSDDFHGNLRIIENNDTQVVFIDEYEGFTIEFLDTENKILYNKNMSIAVSYDADKDSVLITQGDVLVPETDLAVGKTITVYRSKNVTGKKLNRINLETLTVSGIVTLMNNNGVTINGEVYTVMPSAKNDVVLGVTADFIVTPNNEIVGIAASTGDQAREEKIGLFLDYKVGDVDGDCSEVGVKIYDPTDGVIIYDCADKVKTDGVMCRVAREMRDGKDEFAGLAAANTFTLARYIINEDGAISLLDTYLTGTADYNDTLAKLTDTRTKYNLNIPNHAFMSTEGKTLWMCEEEPPAFVVGAEGDEETISHKTAVSVKGPYDNDIHSVTADLYTFDRDNQFVDYVVWFDYATYAKWNDPFIYENQVIMLDEEGETVTKIVGRTPTGKVEYTINDKNLEEVTNLKVLLGALQTGDVLRIKRSNTSISTVELIACNDGSSARAGVTATVSNDTNIYKGDAQQYTRMIYGTVVEKNGKFATIAYNDGTGDTTEPFYLACQLAIYDASSQKIINDLDTSNLLLGEKVLVYISRSTKLLVGYGRQYE